MALLSNLIDLNLAPEADPKMTLAELLTLLGCDRRCTPDSDCQVRPIITAMWSALESDTYPTTDQSGHVWEVIHIQVAKPGIKRLEQCVNCGVFDVTDFDPSAFDHNLYFCQGATND